MNADGGACRTVLTVTANPALDATYPVAGLRPGSTHRVPPALYRAGGKGVNVSRVAHQLGYPTTAIATVGGTTGEQFRADLAAAGIAHQLVDVAVETRRTLAFVDTVHGSTSIFNETGLPLTAADWQALAAAVVDQLQGRVPGGRVDPQAVSGSDGVGVLVGSGSLPEAAPADFYPALVALAHGAGVPAVIDTSGAGLLAAAEAGADLLKPNHHELAAAVGETDLVAAARMLLDRGARRILVSVGEEGMLGFAADRPGTYLQAKLPAPLPGNPTGAGDAAVSAAAVALAQGVEDPAVILRRAAAWGAAAVLMPTAGEISPRHAELSDQLLLTEH